MTTPRTLVVISHYDRRPLENLLSLMSSVEQHDAGREFAICIVVNRESGRPVEIPQPCFALSVLSRQNVGMNIGAWDHGWRENPDYDYYLFLQDECRIRREGWLEGLIGCLAMPGVGMVGESLNYRWDRAWEELTGLGHAGRQEGDGDAISAERARLCLRFMGVRGIPSGKTGRHLRSLVWGFSGETLEKLGGLPIGQTYDECIAAEIAVSRQIEGLGLSLRQAYRAPFYYVGHRQWINVYPGFSTAVTYGEWARRHLSGSSSPFLSLVGKGDRTSRIDQLVSRAETERGLFDGDVIPAPVSGFTALLVVFIDGASSFGDLVPTVDSWCLQSAPDTDLLFVANDEFVLERIRGRVARAEYDHLSQTRICLLSEWLSEDLNSYEFILFSRPGDQFHPSLASVLKLLDVAEKPDIVIWNERKGRAGSGAWLCRQPRFEPVTLRTLGHIGMAFAVRPSWVLAFPYHFVDDLLNAGSHLFHLWLSQRSGVRWTTHPEFLSTRPTDIPPRRASREVPDSYNSGYREILAAGGEFDVSTSLSAGDVSRLVPVRRARSASVIISFRDRAEKTIACLRSLLGQRFGGKLEIVLINNRSGENELAEVRRFTEACRGQRADIKLIDYDCPFNHSRQTNIGVKTSSGEVLVFLNNDAELTAPNILEELSAWALLPAVGTVGCQVRSENGQLLSAGIRARPGPDPAHVSPVEEWTETPYSEEIREVLANTFACAAIARLKFNEIGWLNEAEFPNGYNDVEYCLRGNRQGYRSVCLGHLRVDHDSGTSRGRCDESFQKALLRRRYPELCLDAVFQLSCEWWPWEPEQPADSARPLGMKMALRVLYGSMIYWFQRRILGSA